MRWPRRWQVAEMWDASIENTIRKLAYGTILGALGSLFLFRALPAPPAGTILNPDRVVIRTAAAVVRALYHARARPPCAQAAERAPHTSSC